MIPFRPSLLQPKPKRPTRGKAVTIAIGMYCRDGVIIAADSQISSPDYYKYHESKVNHSEGTNWRLLYAYANRPDLYKEARESIVRKFNNSEPTPENLYSICDGVFTDMGRHYADVGLEMMIGLSCPRFDTKLLTFTGKSLLWETEKIRCLGVGDSSLTRYLSENLYTSTISTEEGKKIAIYIIAKAKAYIDHCGGDTIVYSLRDGAQLTAILPDEISRLESEMNAAEKNGLKAFVGL